jgi:hypothetical protein
MIDFDASKDREAFNQWIEDLQADIEFQPLIDFLERLKEPEPKTEEAKVEQ